MDAGGSEPIEGRNPVLEALRAGRAIDRLLVAEGTSPGFVDKLAALARERGVRVEFVGRAHLEGLARSRAHQGVVAFAPAREYAGVEDVLARAGGGGAALVVALDGVEDPQNLGAIIRSCDAAGAHGVVLTERRSAPLGPGAVKASAGAVEHVPVARVVNLVRTLETLKEVGLWVYGADGQGDRVYHEVDLTGPAVIVIGGEGHGLSRLVKERCDFLIRIPMFGKVNSLNASAAAAVILFEARRQRGAAGRPAP
ncbi:MAG: 23S rRNA (guanosine(2251)-2'-O)-methyltransferase RlmB [Bacillota bacterium]